ncbi:SIN3-HDAC complex-associated factor [Trichonephila clavata]|uniref:SIN3-HDAC complex-associated factor n=1 Tax=Trichonephila clavata TaxID=2740835 RepID=A0A8X6H4R7_TRICU|nr:SIN3-HDAC complex-associated factor [Trichonephila clavata]
MRFLKEPILTLPMSTSFDSDSTEIEISKSQEYFNASFPASDCFILCRRCGGSVNPGRGNLSLWLGGFKAGRVMFSFHKPKIYRSINGCCICKAKSSSSRFTDSKKYEPEFERCFRISEKRSGEICNACVLLVKRWKKLPIGTNRDWHHVVDARAGPGTKCTTKNKIKTERKPAKKLRLRLCRSKHLSTEVLSDDVAGNEDSLSESSSLSVPLSRVPSPSPSNSSDDSTVLEEPDEDMDQDIIAKKRRAKGIINKIGKHRKTPCNNHKKSSFLDMTFWREERICCGVIFRGPHGEALIYPKLLRPCHCRRNGESANRFMSQGDGTSFLPNATNTATHVACSTGRNQFPNGISA